MNQETEAWVIYQSDTIPVTYYMHIGGLFAYASESLELLINYREFVFGIEDDIVLLSIEEENSWKVVNYQQTWLEIVYHKEAHFIIIHLEYQQGKVRLVFCMDVTIE